MTVPHPIIPTDQPRWPDVEKAMVTVLDDMLQALDPPGYACVVPPQNEDELVATGRAVVQVVRTGGSNDRTADDASISINVTTAYRSDSWEVMGWLRPKLLEFSGVVTNPDGSQALVMGIQPAQGPQKDPARAPVNSQVGLSFTVTTRLDR